MVGEPVHRAGPDTDSGHGGFVVVDLGVGDAGVVVDDGVNECVPELGVVPLVLRFVRCDGAALPVLLSTDVAPAAVGNVPDLLHTHMHQRAG